jgi:hypothetical protein
MSLCKAVTESVLSLYEFYVELFIVEQLRLVVSVQMNGWDNGMPCFLWSLIVSRSLTYSGSDARLSDGNSQPAMFLAVASAEASQKCIHLVDEQLSFCVDIMTPID